MTPTTPAAVLENFDAARTYSAPYRAARERFIRQNIEVARNILADVERHGGEAAGRVIWARMISRAAKERRAG